MPRRAQSRSSKPLRSLHPPRQPTKPYIRALCGQMCRRQLHRRKASRPAMLHLPSIALAALTASPAESARQACHSCCHVSLLFTVFQTDAGYQQLLYCQFVALDLNSLLSSVVIVGSSAYPLWSKAPLRIFASTGHCLYADLAASGLVPSLLQIATAAPEKLDAGSLVLALDGCARLQHQIPAEVLDSLAFTAERMTASFDSLQLPLVLWAFSILQFNPL